MHLAFEIKTADKRSFLEHWSEKYDYPDDEKYTRNVGKPLTEASRQELFEWKNGAVLSNAKRTSILGNYPLVFSGDQRARYLNHRELGGAIWNIFYLHCLEPGKWPIFDQHTFRAMRYIQSGHIVEIGITNKQKYMAYEDQYVPFLRTFEGESARKVDKALFAFGQFLKLAARYA
jgi:hypothetical protein